MATSYENTNFRMGTEIRLSGFPGSFYSCRLGAGEGPFTVSPIFQDVQQGEAREHVYDVFGITDESATIRALAMSDVAYANLDDLVDVIDSLGASEFFGNNDPGSLSCPILQRVKDIINTQINQEYRASALAIINMMAGFATPGDFLYRVRETMFARADVSYDSETKKLTYSSAALGECPVDRKQLHKALIQTKVLSEAEHVDHDGYHLQVLPAGGVNDTLALGGQVQVSSTEELELFTAFDLDGAALTHLPDGFGAPSVVMDLTQTYTGVYNSEVENSIRTAGKDATISAATIKYHKFSPLFSSLATQNYKENARALSVAYASIAHPWRASKGDASRFDSSQLTASGFIEHSNDCYLVAPPVQERAVTWLDKSQAVPLKPFKTRSHKNRERVIWSVDVSDTQRSVLLKLPFVAAAIEGVRAAGEYATLAVGGYKALTQIPLPSGEVVEGFVSTASQFDNAEQFTSAFCSEYAGEAASRAGYGDVACGLGKSRFHLFPVTLKDIDYLLPQFLSVGTDLVLGDPDQYAEALRQDAESEWNAAVQSLKDSGLQTSKRGCNPGLLLLAGGAVYAASREDASDDSTKETTSNI